VRALTGTRYLARRAEAISLTAAMSRAEPGQPGIQTLQRAIAPDETTESAATSHMSAVDSAGNAVALTSSIENAFGSGIFVRGFLLNNHMTDFALNPGTNTSRAINRIEPGKRPRSTMAPTIVTDRNGRLVLALGSPGGPRIIPYVVQTLIGVIDWNLDMQRAISLPRHVNMNGATELERGTALVDLADDLRKLGHQIEIKSETSGLHGIMVSHRGRNTVLIGGADPRREGVALGD
jgi:gamma-glutamyltranspeptidase/glutathione hydrolase